MSGGADPFRTPEYAATYRVSRPADTPDWWREGAVGLVVAVFATLLGGLVGVVWHALAPHVDIVPAAQGSSAAMKSLIGDDLWLGLVGAIAGVVCVAGLVAVAPRAARGPGAMLGLAVGGLLGMIVAARVGHLIGHHDLTSALRAGDPGIDARTIKLVLSYFDFSVRAKAVLLTWPFVAVLLNTMVVGLRPVKSPTPRIASAYPGSS